MKRRRNPLEQRPQFRRFLNVQELTLALAVLVILMGMIFGLQSRERAAGTAVVYLDGEEILSVKLRERYDYPIDLLEEYGVPVSFELRESGICFVDVDCPDHICERTGVISSPGQTAVCMPNKVAVVIRESEETGVFASK